MPIKLMYITNRPEIALIAEEAGTDRIFVDLERLWKADRQGGMDTVQSRHTVGDIKRIREVITKAELLARCNPVHDHVDGYLDTEDEIEEIIRSGADIIMLPFFKQVDEAKRFLSAVQGRCRTMLLFETPEAVENVEEILALPGIDEAYIGLNDLSIGYHKKFMFELLADGTVEKISEHFVHHQIPFGFGGIAAIGEGTLPSEMILKEHYRLGSIAVILSRSFCNCNKENDLELIRKRFFDGIARIRGVEEECLPYYKKENEVFFEENKAEIKRVVAEITKQKVKDEA